MVFDWPKVGPKTAPWRLTPNATRQVRRIRKKRGSEKRKVRRIRRTEGDLHADPMGRRIDKQRIWPRLTPRPIAPRDSSMLLGNPPSGIYRESFCNLAFVSILRDCCFDGYGSICKLHRIRSTCSLLNRFGSWPNTQLWTPRRPKFICIFCTCRLYCIVLYCTVLFVLHGIVPHGMVPSF